MRYVLIFILLFCFTDVSLAVAQQDVLQTQEQQVSLAPEIPFSVKARAVVAIRKRQGVLAANFEQQDYFVSLSLTLARGITQDTAKELMQEYYGIVKNNLVPYGDMIQRFSFGLNASDSKGQTIVSGLKPYDIDTLIWSDDESFKDLVVDQEADQETDASPSQPPQSKTIDPLDMMDFPPEKLKEKYRLSN